MARWCLALTFAFACGFSISNGAPEAAKSPCLYEFSSLVMELEPHRQPDVGELVLPALRLLLLLKFRERRLVHRDKLLPLVGVAVHLGLSRNRFQCPPTGFDRPDPRWLALRLRLADRGEVRRHSQR